MSCHINHSISLLCPYLPHRLVYITAMTHTLLYVTTMSHRVIFLNTLSHRLLYLTTMSHRVIFCNTLSHRLFYLTAMSHRLLFLTAISHRPLYLTAMSHRPLYLTAIPLYHLAHYIPLPHTALNLLDNFFYWINLCSVFSLSNYNHELFFLLIVTHVCTRSVLHLI